jgi:DNA-binding ferritin-like protein
MSEPGLGAASLSLLNGVLADSIDVRQRMLPVRWACKRAAAERVPAIVEQLSWHLDRIIDVLAERILSQGGVPLADAEHVAVHSRMPLYSYANGAPAPAIQAAKSLAVYSVALRAASDVARSLGDGPSAAILARSWRELGLILWQFDQRADLE